MDIIFYGQQSQSEAEESLAAVIRLFRERYQINTFREMHLTLTLVNEQGEDVELVDNETSQVYRVFEVYSGQKGREVLKGKGYPGLKLVIDNTH